ncbi:hypothetical protein O181_125937 [Austropuccinia psidii MF-1]|uniref:Uncharacterized protein n=1 Tax=Austropuccinia psidii MF-1 TaxID=1389203 RepID=A0A9Q3Q7Z4_9BASI|nr:hypothetical protein [Austropuccinia psidii MF-1]
MGSTIRFRALRPKVHVTDGTTHVNLMELHYSQLEPTRNPHAVEPLYANGAENPEIYGCLILKPTCTNHSLGNVNNSMQLTNIQTLMDAMSC